ncbi:MAG TPA: MBL fold metallo-hydrolase [Casimicrobiaceae bacterium]|jgi:phosphoribosyl 1,2-cyclic phosphodiesterase
MMRVRFWGTRGSLPVALGADALRAKLRRVLREASGRRFTTAEDIDTFLDTQPFALAGTYGGNTSCVQIDPGGNEYVLCDLGSGARAFAQAMMAKHGADGQTYHILVSHLHWDHIMGLPFFTPAYMAGNRLRIYGGHAELEMALRRQQDRPSFPVDFSAFKATIEFIHLETGRAYDIAGMRVTVKLQRHAGDSYGYRFEGGGRSVVYSTDSEHTLADPLDTQGFVDFFRDADLVIFDAMYSLADAISVKADWGHSSNIVGVELCQMARVGHLCLFHHEPAIDDEAISHLLVDAQRLEELTSEGKGLRVSAAYDGMEIML